MNMHKNKNKQIKQKPTRNHYIMVARMPEEPTNGMLKRKTYTKMVTVNTAMKLIHGVPTIEPKMVDMKTRSGYPYSKMKMVVTKRTPLSRHFTRVK